MFFRLVVPLLLWAVISIIIETFGATSTPLTHFLDDLLKFVEVQPNYWFIPCLFATSIYYWIFAKIIKKLGLLLL